MTLERISNHTANIADLAAIRAEGELLDVPSVLDGWRHAVAYWGGTMRSLVGSHHLRVDRVESCAARTVIPPAFRDRWQQLYAHDGVIVPVPYLYNQSVGTLLYTRIFAQMGINLRNLLHVQHQTTHYVPIPEWMAAEHQELHVSLRGAWRLGDDKALIALRSAVHHQREDGGGLIGTSNDRFIIRNVPEPDLAVLASGRPLMRSVSALRRKTPELDPSAPGTKVAEIPLSPDMGTRFGSLSGDYSPWHTTPLSAKIFGFKRPFLQGLGLRNALVRQLVLAGYPLIRFQMSFTTPAYLGQTLRLVMQGQQFEVVSAEGRVVSFGSANDET
jgi:hypothetical protein